MARLPLRPTPGGQNGGAVDWQAALTAHQGWLRKVVLARVGRGEAVDEVMQEVSLAAIAQRTPIADPEKVAPWLYRVAVRNSLLYLRKRGRRQRLAEQYARRMRSAGDDSRTRDPLEWLLADERRELVQKALGRLPRRYAEVLLLKYGEDWSYRELAAHLGTSPSAIEARLHRARGCLRNEILALEGMKHSDERHPS